MKRAGTYGKKVQSVALMLCYVFTLFIGYVANIEANTRDYSAADTTLSTLLSDTFHHATNLSRNSSERIITPAQTDDTPGKDHLAAALYGNAQAHTNINQFYADRRIRPLHQRKADLLFPFHYFW